MFPDDFKQAHVSPLLKKTSLPKDDLNSYVPISNLSFISKILERVVASRLTSHIRLNGLFNVSQSAYKQFHSTETALLKVHNDITLNMDKGKVLLLSITSYFMWCSSGFCSWTISLHSLHNSVKLSYPKS